MESIFSNQNFLHLAELFFWLLGAFIIGFYFGTIAKSKKTIKTKEKDDVNNDDAIDLINDITKIRATKTFDRGGKETVQTVFENNPESSNFETIENASSKDKDDLTKIKGIGSSIEKKLNAIGIYNYQQITNLTSKDILQITELIKFFPGRIERDDWVGQAYKLMNHKNE
ncbi:helix-hairpin-helix domain-containing protein [Lutibacter sp.]|uniref:helix-hairpin-helix domain-containing protein n=1 Tax=Lutibacter sp. TaxID=1925666 RepID=UPI00356300CE